MQTAHRLNQQMVLLSLCALMCSSGCHVFPFRDPAVSGPVLSAPAPSLAQATQRSAPSGNGRVTVTPTQQIAPVGTEVILMASTMVDGYQTSGERVDWVLMQGGAGKFLRAGGQNQAASLFTNNAQSRVEPNYVVGYTLGQDEIVSRGNGAAAQAVTVRRGQGWVVLTSETEGTSTVNVYAPGMNQWAQQQQTSVIHWVDVQWTFPAPSNAPLGTRQSLSTTVTRQSNQAPATGWIVRYAIAGGTPGVFAPNNTTTVDVPVDANGQANVELLQTTPVPGTTEIAMSIMRVADDGQRIVVGQGSSHVTWSSELSMQVLGPQQGSLGSTLTYQVQIINAGDRPTGNINLTTAVPPGLAYLSSSPQAGLSTGRLDWNLGSLPARQSRAITVDYRIDAPGPKRLCFDLQSPEGRVAQACADTQVLASTLHVRIEAPAQVQVGQNVTMQFVVSNRGTTPTGKLLVKDRFDDGLQHEVAASPIERDLESLQPGESRAIAVTFQVTKPGQLCNHLEVTGESGLRAAAQHCVTATAPGTPAQPQPAPQPGQPQPQPAQPQSAMKVSLTGPPTRRIGELAEFEIVLENTGGTELTNVRISNPYDAAMAPIKATTKYRYDRPQNELSWLIDRLPVGQAIKFQAVVSCDQTALRACSQIAVACDQGITSQDNHCLEIQPQVPGLRVTITDLNDFVKVGQEINYEIRVKNEGNLPHQQVMVTVTAPNELAFDPLGIRAEVRHDIDGKTLTFHAFPEVRGNETLTYRVRTKALRPGEAMLRVRVQSDQQTQPVSETETTSVVADR